MTANYLLTADDFADAQFTHIHKILGKKVILIYVLIAAFLLSSIAFFSNDPGIWQQVKPFWVFGAFLTAFYVLVWSGYLSRRQFKKIKALHQPVSMTADDDGIMLSSARGEGKTNWAAYETWRESKVSFLLYPQPAMFYIIPKRALGGEGVTAFRDLLKSKIR